MSDCSLNSDPGAREEAVAGPKRNLKLKLEYDGSKFHGWQYQVGQRTVQGVFEETLMRLTGENIRVTAASRTDAGVHALEQVLNFRTASPHAPEVFLRALNALLPSDIAVLTCEEAPAGFNARFWARGKIYRYLIYNRPQRRAFGHSYSWHFPWTLDASAMTKAASHLIGSHDFSAFAAKSREREGKDPTREMRRLELVLNEQGYILFELEAGSFLKQMARNIIGTLALAGARKIEPETVKDILESKDRKTAGPTAPASGLYLIKVLY